MNENENITTTEQSIPLVTATADSETPVTTYETSETICADCDLSHIQHNTDGIFLMTSGIFFLLVIYFIGKFLGNFFSM